MLPRINTGRAAGSRTECGHSRKFYQQKAKVLTCIWLFRGHYASGAVVAVFQGQRPGHIVAAQRVRPEFDHFSDYPEAGKPPASEAVLAKQCRGIFNQRLGTSAAPHPIRKRRGSARTPGRCRAAVGAFPPGVPVLDFLTSTLKMVLETTPLRIISDSRRGFLRAV